MTPTFVRSLYALSVVLILVGAFILTRPWRQAADRWLFHVESIRTHGWQPTPLSSERKRIGTIAFGGGFALLLIAKFGPRIERIEVRKAKSPWDSPDDQSDETRE